jgi:zinc protease
VDKSDMQLIKDAIVQAINNAKENDVDPELLAKTKSHLKYSFAMRIDNPDEIAGSLSHYVMLTGNPESLNKLYALYDEVSAEDLRRVAKTYFLPNALTIATISADNTGGVK